MANSFLLGDRVTVTGYTSKGKIRWKGNLPGFLPTLGIELDDPVGENNGFHAGRSVFKCDHGHGVFSTPDQVGLVVVRVRTRAIPDMPGIMIGARCSVSKVRCKGTVRWTGKLPTSQPGIFSVGIELDRAVGEHAGVVRGRFNLFQAATNCGIVVMPEEVKLAPSSSRGSSNRRRRSGSARSAGASDEGRRATMSIMESALKMGDWVRVVGFNCNGQIKWMGTLKSDHRPVPRIGVELNKPIGLHNGTIEGQVLFTCAPKHGVVAHISKVSPASVSEVAANEGSISMRQRSSSLGGAPVILVAGDDPYNDPTALAASAFEGFGGFSEPAPLPPVLPPVGFNGFDEPELPPVPGQQRSGSVAARSQKNSRDEIIAKLLAYYAKHAPGTKTSAELEPVTERCIEIGTGWLDAPLSKKYGERFSDFSAGHTARPTRRTTAVADLTVVADPVYMNEAANAAALDPASAAARRISSDPMYINDDDAFAATVAAETGPPGQRQGEEPLPAIPPPGSSAQGVDYSKSLGSAASKSGHTVADSTATMAAPWDCADLDKEQALKRLIGTGPGAFVIRGSSSAHAVLSMKTTEGKMFHRKIIKTPVGIALDESTSFFGSFNELIAHYMVARPDGLLPSPLNVIAPLKTAEGFYALFDDKAQAKASLKLELANGMYGFDDAENAGGVEAAAPARSPAPPLPPPEVPDYSAAAVDYRTSGSPGKAIKIDGANGLYGEAGADLPAPRDENNNIRVDVINDLYAQTQIDFGFGSDKFEDFGFDDEPVINIGAWVTVLGYSAPGHVRWVGYLDIENPPVMRCGVELTEPIGKNSGTVKGQYLFTCDPKHGVCADMAKCRLRDDADPEAEAGVHGSDAGDEDAPDLDGIAEDDAHPFDMVLSMISADEKAEEVGEVIEAKRARLSVSRGPKTQKSLEIAAAEAAVVGFIASGAATAEAAAAETLAAEETILLAGLSL